MDTSSSLVKSLIYTPGDKPQLQVLDQLLIPAEKVYVDVPNVESAWAVIREMKVRGAPLIAIVAGLGLAVDLHSDQSKQELSSLETPDAVGAYLFKKMDYLLTSRPTAVNLFNAMAELKVKVITVQHEGADRMIQEIVKYAEFMLERDMHDNKSIGRNGADELLKSGKTNLTLMTICNTGALACAYHGTALGIVRELRDRQQLKSIVALETRPYNQGSRLTAFELTEENMPGAKLITDSMAAAFMRQHPVDGIVVGADRVCRNGDTANKIGTYQLSLTAHAHGVPFYVAAPFTTFDLEIATGDDVVIEERPAVEFLSTSQAPKNISVWNPAFDITPAKYITGIVTDKGVILKKADGTFDIPGFLGQQTNVTKLQVPPDYREQTAQSLPAYLEKNAPIAMEMLGATTAEDLTCVEMGDGNLNLVFIVTSKQDASKQVIVKQALPYVRCVGESWPMTLERAYFEYLALTAEKECCPQYVPTVYYFSRPHALIIMQYFAPPNIILRQGFIRGIRYPTMANDMGIFCARTLFLTSGFHLETTELRKKVEFWSRNSDMCALTEQVVFTEPYMEASNNRWTSPQLDADKKEIENDTELKAAAAKFKIKFVSDTQALIHGDLHSGSVMCSPAPEQTFVIDPEFAFYGPMGFDLGAFIANMFLAYVSQDGHSNGSDYADWILEQVITFWKTFETQFLQLWDDPATHKGYVYGRQTLKSPEEVKNTQTTFMKEILADSLGFAGMKMLRRIVGIAHVADLDTIADPDVRSVCERHGLTIAKYLIKNSASIPSIENAVQIARDKKQ